MKNPLDHRDEMTKTLEACWKLLLASAIFQLCFPIAVVLWIWIFHNGRWP